MKTILLFVLVIVGVHGATQLANYPVITQMKSGDHKLLTASTPGNTTLTYDQGLFQSFPNIPRVAISIRDIQSEGTTTNSTTTSNEINYKCTISASTILASQFTTTLELISSNTFSLLYYMYIAIDVVAFTNTYLYFYSIDTSTLFNDTAGISNITSYTIAQTVTDFSNGKAVPIVMSFHITTAHQYSFYAQATMTSSNTFDLNLTSNSNLQRIQLTVFIIDKTAMQSTYTFFFDTGNYEVLNNNGIPTSSFSVPSFNYFNYVLGLTAMRINSSFNINFVYAADNTFFTTTQYILLRHTAVHWRKRQCINPSTIGKFVLEHQLCYDVCPTGYSTNSSLDYCVLCSYTCSTCEVDGVSCLTCPASSFRTLNNVTIRCPCDTGYFDNNTVICATCDYTCLTCQSLQTNCISCNTSRTLTNNTCPCSTGFYDIGNNTQTCSACHYSCLTCSGSATSCTSCDTTTHFRVFIAATSECLCRSGFQDAGVSICTVSTISCNAPCLTCQNTANTCTSCSLTNNPSDRVISGSTCACPTFYSAVSSTATCTQICGNGVMPTATNKQCDDGQQLSGDGCSSTCTIESGFSCNITQNPSICTSNSGYSITSQTLTKDSRSNTLTAVIQMTPVPPQSISATLTNLQDTVSLQSSSVNRGTVTILMTLLKAVSNSPLLNIRLSVIQATTALPLVDSNNAQLVPYDQTYYSIYEVEAGLIWTYIAVLWIVSIYRLITDPKLISQVTELYFYSCIVAIGVEGQREDLAPLVPLQNLKYLYGYNITIDQNNSLFAVFNISFIYLLLPLLLFAIFLFISNKKPGLIASRTKRFILYDLSFAWLMINGFLITYGLSLSITEQTSFGGATAGGIIVGVVYLVGMLVIIYRSFFRGAQTDEMNSTLQYTKKNLFKPRIYCVIWLSSLIVCFMYLSVKNHTKVNPMLMIGYFLFLFVLVGVGNVYINKLRSMLNLVSLAFIYGCILLLNNIEQSAYIGIVIVVLMFVQLITNFAIMHFQRNNLRVDEDDMLEDKVKKQQIANHMPQGESKGDQSKRQILDLAGHTGLFTVYQPKKDIEMNMPRPSPKMHEENIIDVVMRNQEEMLDKERRTDIKPHFNEFLLTSPKINKMFDSEEKKREEFIDLDRRGVNMDDF